MSKLTFNKEEKFLAHLSEQFIYKLIFITGETV